MRDNPYLGKLQSTYKDLALAMRDGTCNTCHVPNNPDKMKRLVLLQTPAHAAGEIARLMSEVRNNRMPLDDLGIEKELDADDQGGAAQVWRRVRCSRECGVCVGEGRLTQDPSVGPN